MEQRLMTSPSSPAERPSQLPPPPQTTSDGQKRGALKLDRRTSQRRRPPRLLALLHHTPLDIFLDNTASSWTPTPRPPERLFPVVVYFLVSSDKAKDNTWPRHPSKFPYNLFSLPIPPFLSASSSPPNLQPLAHSSSFHLSVYLPQWLQQQEPRASNSIPSTTTLTSPLLLPSRSTATLAT